MGAAKEEHVCKSQDIPGKKWKFSEILADNKIKERWEKVRKFFFLRESTYDMTNKCNIRCEGCYYYEGEKQFAKENKDIDAWRSLMKAEKKRGITFVVLAGAEPSLVPELCQVCYEEIPLGAVATNGIKFISENTGYKIHISVWGNDKTSHKLRGAKNMLSRQIENYIDDPRAVFVYTFTRNNIDEAREIAEILADKRCRLTFNMFSAPSGYEGELRHNPSSLLHTRETIMDLIAQYPENILYSAYNTAAHTHQTGLHGLYGCSYPRMNPSTDIGLGRSFRQYRTDLTWDRDAACCVPDTDCDDCRHYAAGSAVVTARMFRHAVNPELFKAWLDYVDTYLSVWVTGYEKGKNLCDNLTAPPGFKVF
ncbi:Radical SAM domain-containing protein [Desulfonema limicola]|uniref:Radical SAM domain-containing protein n=1 Tax=Desulfonema limicola TaxID=45656 RepID=A0A975GG83_9BACT|nr:radical SAM protein [Desulfonema limicola]QTA80040.1 Radical SAM domain-containing protein [Desulfonema limicola]